MDASNSRLAFVDKENPSHRQIHQFSSSRIISVQSPHIILIENFLDYIDMSNFIPIQILGDISEMY